MFPRFVSVVCVFDDAAVIQHDPPLRQVSQDAIMGDHYDGLATPVDDSSSRILRPHAAICKRTWLIPNCSP